MENDPTVPRFSIVLPTHDRADVIGFAIRSALSQTEGGFELLIAGDGCTDRTAEVVASFDDRRIRWFDFPKAPGVGYANRNRALREARGRYVAYLAHDDLWFPDHLERLGALLDETGAEFAYSRGLAVDTDGRITPYWYNLEIPRHAQELGRTNSLITICTVVHARACLDTYGYWDETLLRAADKELWHRILVSGEFGNLAFLSEPTALHFVADWRNTRAHRALARLKRWLIGGLLRTALPQALQLPTREGETQQETAWRRLSEDPAARVREMRRAVIQFQDALLWKSQTPAGFVGLRLGLALAATLDRLYMAARWIASPELRRRRRKLVGRLRALDARRAESGRRRASGPTAGV
jgi:hypothetical protein